MNTPFITSARTNFHEKVHRHLRREEKLAPLIWCGDLNTAIRPVDAYVRGNAAPNNPGTKLLEREALQLIIDETNLTDTYRWFHPKANAKDYTWHPLSLQSHARGQRLDYFMSSAHLHGEASPFQDCNVDSRQQGSDHLPVGLRVNFRNLGDTPIAQPQTEMAISPTDLEAPDPDPSRDIDEYLADYPADQMPMVDIVDVDSPTNLIFKSNDQ